ncbi:MAG: hypothetical protein QOF52_909, partial [Propionibacteriaceae bacterium]|nr:hypothetical protein [Propionibacteriaceae bacterium]
LDEQERTELVRQLRQLANRLSS